MDTALTPRTRPVGHLLREWRQRRRYSQLALASDARISPRHLSFIESGRARPSRQMLLHLAERLDLPLRERNRLLLCAGFAPVFQESALDSAELDAVRRAIDAVLSGLRPYPALAVDRGWNLVAANDAVAPLLAAGDPALLHPPVNVLRLSLHPAGLAPRIVNLAQWRGHILGRVERQQAVTGDAGLSELLDELRSYPAPVEDSLGHEPGTEHLVPFKLATAQGVLAFISTTMVFGTPLNVTAAELAIESFFPADAATAQALKAPRSGA
jgi:transcriptional regulator with XRE-family HTH domain